MTARSVAASAWGARGGWSGKTKLDISILLSHVIQLPVANPEDRWESAVEPLWILEACGCEMMCGCSKEQPEVQNGDSVGAPVVHIAACSILLHLGWFASGVETTEAELAALRQDSCQGHSQEAVELKYLYNRGSNHSSHKIDKIVIKVPTDEKLSSSSMVTAVKKILAYQWHFPSEEELIPLPGRDGLRLLLRGWSPVWPKDQFLESGMTNILNNSFLMFLEINP